MRQRLLEMAGQEVTLVGTLARVQGKTALFHAIEQHDVDHDTRYALREVVDRLLPLPPDEDKAVWREYA